MNQSKRARRQARVLKAFNVIAIFLIVVLLIVAVTQVANTYAAKERCRDMGGVTWDGGRHCILGDFTTVNTR